MVAYGDNGDLASWWEGQLTLGVVVNIGGVGDKDFFDKSHDESFVCLSE